MNDSAALTVNKQGKTIYNRHWKDDIRSYRTEKKQYKRAFDRLAED